MECTIIKGVGVQEAAMSQNYSSEQGILRTKVGEKCKCSNETDCS